MTFSCRIAVLTITALSTAIVEHNAAAAHAQRAQAAIQSNQTATAESELDELLDPYNISALANLAMIAYTKGDDTNAATQFEAALARSPSLRMHKHF